MADKIMHTRIIHTHDIEKNWEATSNFIPRAGELICYDPDTEHDSARVKIGDGVQSINELPFFVDSSITCYFSESDGIVYLDGGNITSYQE